MPRFLIEREIPGASELTSGELRAISTKSNEVLAGMARRAQWVQSFVTDDRIYCLYFADDENAILEHARCGGFPANRVTRVARVIDPTTAEVA
jgi:hypothetical protein